MKSSLLHIISILCSYLLCSPELMAQAIPAYGNDFHVTVSGYSMDLMEPHVSPDGNALFFNSLNDGINTKLYYAAKVNDSVFNFLGEVPLVNQTITPQLNAVASVDTASHFYWVSARGWPGILDNLHHVKFSNPPVNFGRVHGDIYVNAPGWIIMDAAITTDGNQLYYANAKFNNCNFNLPCRSALGIAQKTNDTLFSKLANSGAILAAVNDTSNYIIYAPQLSDDGLELYFTRAAINTTVTEICVALRTNTSSAFSAAQVLINMPGNVPEAATISKDKSKLYYHRLYQGKYQIFLKYRLLPTLLNEINPVHEFSIGPNPANDKLLIYSKKELKDASLYLINLYGQTVHIRSNLQGHQQNMDLNGIASGIYFLRMEMNGCILLNKKIVLSE